MFGIEGGIAVNVSLISIIIGILIGLFVLPRLRGIVS